MRRFTIIILVVFILCTTISGCSPAKKVATDKPIIVTTIYPLYYFTSRLVGDKMTIISLIPPGAEPHEWEPSTDNIRTIQGAELFIYNGDGLEPIGKILESNPVLETVAASRGIPTINSIADKHNTEDTDHDGTTADPHIWLSPRLAKHEAFNICQALIKIDPANRDFFETNLQNLSNDLDKLDSDYRRSLADANPRDIVTSHAAFAYLCREYDLKQISVMGISPDTEPDAASIAKIVNYCRQNHVRYIFTEPLIIPRLAATIAQEAGIGILELNPLESLTDEDITQKRDYLSIMYCNLENLKKALL